MKLRLRRSRRSTIVCLLFALVTGLLVGTYINHAQTSCSLPGHLSSLTPRWTPEAAITVIYDQSSNFTTAQLTAMNTAFHNWNVWNGSSGHFTGVTFVGFNLGQHQTTKQLTILFMFTRAQTVHLQRESQNGFPLVLEPTQPLQRLKSKRVGM